MKFVTQSDEFMDGWLWGSITGFFIGILLCFFVSVLT